MHSHGPYYKTCLRCIPRPPGLALKRVSLVVWQLRAAQSESSQMARELQLARDEALWHQSGRGAVLESHDGALAALEGSLHQVK